MNISFNRQLSEILTSFSLQKSLDLTLVNDHYTKYKKGLPIKPLSLAVIDNPVEYSMSTYMGDDDIKLSDMFIDLGKNNYFYLYRERVFVVNEITSGKNPTAAKQGRSMVLSLDKTYNYQLVSFKSPLLDSVNTINSTLIAKMLAGKEDYKLFNSLSSEDYRVTWWLF